MKMLSISLLLCLMAVPAAADGYEHTPGSSWSYGDRSNEGYYGEYDYSYKNPPDYRDPVASNPYFRRWHYENHVPTPAWHYNNHVPKPTYPPLRGPRWEH